MRKFLSCTGIRLSLGCGLLAAALAAVLPVHAAAQSLYGSLTGNVTDETGAALPGANATVTQTETNL